MVPLPIVNNVQWARLLGIPMAKKKKFSFYVVDNDAIDRKLDIAHTVLKARKSKTKCLAPREGEGFRI